MALGSGWPPRSGCFKIGTLREAKSRTTETPCCPQGDGAGLGKGREGKETRAVTTNTTYKVTTSMASPPKCKPVSFVFKYISPVETRKGHSPTQTPTHEDGCHPGGSSPRHPPPTSSTNHQLHHLPGLHTRRPRVCDVTFPDSLLARTMCL